ncbi:MAG: response regulator [Chloroflexi bacterium]|nr:response regulator [Chloroflexota bacterium]
MQTTETETLANSTNEYVVMKSVLIVEDNRDLRSIFGKMFRKFGYQVTTAVDGQQALVFLRHNRYQVLILDINMPNLSGRDVLARIRDEDLKRDMKIIVVTGDCRAEESAEVGTADLFLTKPVSTIDLVILANRLVVSG